MALHPDLIHTSVFKIRTYDVDHQKVITVPSLIKLMHEAAMENVINLKVSVWDLEQRHISWVLMRKCLQFFQMPLMGEKISIETYPAGFEKYFTYRDYKVYNESGKMLAKASSVWLLMDTHTRRLTQIPEDILAYQMPDPSRCLPRPSGNIPKLTDPDWSQTYHAGWFDLDFNQHLNNVYYLQWMIETVGDSILQSHVLRELDIVYKAESQWKDILVSQTQKLESDTFLHQLVRKTDHKLLAHSRTRWE